jgi:hypothetical protein
MKYKLVLKNVIFLIGIVLLGACAQVVAPTGGEKDILPPVVLEMKPNNESTNFEGNEIIIVFDEYVKLQKLKEELIVSPPLKYSLETKIKGKELHLKIKDTLKSNTTYVLNFGDAIVDVHENNALKNYSYVFATGEKIDTLSVSGRIINSFDAKVESGVLVMLYDSYEDSIPLKELPNYVGRTNKDGLYEIRNIKYGEYKIFVLKDENKNYLFDQVKEKIAFDTNLISITNPLLNKNFYLFEEDKEKQYISEQKEKGANVVLDFNRPFDSVLIKAIDTNINDVLLFQQFGKKKDSISLWFKEMDKGKLKVSVDDCLNYKDTITLKIDSAPNSIVFKMAARQNYFEKVRFSSRTPISKVIDSLITITTSDSLIIDFKIVYSENTHEFWFDFKMDQDSSYIVSILPNAILDIYKTGNDSIIKTIKVNGENDFGNLAITLSSSIYESKIIQLLDSKGDVLQSVSINHDLVTFKHLNPAKYRLKCLVDKNENGKWDTGNYLENILPERTILFNEEIAIRANWDKEIIWELDKIANDSIK